MRKFIRKDSSHIVVLSDEDKRKIKYFEENEDYLELFEGVM